MGVAEAPPEGPVHATPIQSQFIECEARYPGYIGGRGSAKSTASILKAMAFMLRHPGPGDAMFTVPTLGDIKKILLPRFRKHFGSSEGREWGYLEKESTIKFPNMRWQIFVRPASEPDSCRGPDLAFGAMDEIGTEDQEETFRILQAAIRQTGFPNQLWVTSTPNVRRRWIKQRWQDKVNPLDGRPLPNPEQYPIFKARMQDNPHLPEWFREELAAEWGSSRWAKQELEGEFISVEGMAFPELSEEIHLKDPPHGTEFVKTVTGMDFGATSPTALITIRQSKDNRLWVTDEFYQRNATGQEWARWIGEHGISRLIADPSLSENDRLDFQRKYGVVFRRARNKRFDARYKFWASRLSVAPGGKPGIFISPSCKNLWDELMNLAFLYTRGRDYANDEWEPGSSDHAYDAGAYAGMEFEGVFAGLPKFDLEYVGYNR